MKSIKVKESDCSRSWSIPFSGQDRWVPYGPDMNATYWFYPFERSTTDTFGIKFQGEYAHARYQGFNIYNGANGQLINGDSSVPSSIRDVNIVPDSGSQNPFQLGVNRDVKQRSYSVVLVPEGADTSQYANAITFPTSVTQISVYLRVYLPDQNLGGKDQQSGGVPLPAIQAFDPATGEAVPCPSSGQKLQKPGSNSNPSPPDNREEVLFYRVSGANYYPNQDNLYLITLFDKIGDKVAIFRFKPPTFTHTEHSRGIIPTQAMVRYWSLNLYSQRLTNVTACLADYQATETDGLVTIVLARRDPRVLAKVKQDGLNFLPWGDHNEVAITYRNLVTNPTFAYPISLVPTYSSGQPAAQQSADRYIGDYGPRGYISTVEEFLKQKF